MSQCMTIVDETIDQKDNSTEVTPKDIVEFILEETLLSVFIISDKDCRRIGDFNITDDFSQQYDRLSCLRDFEQVEHSQNQSGSNQEFDLNLNFGENTDRLSSLATAKENLEIIRDTFIRKEEKIKPTNECTIISEEVLADNELQIKNGQIHLEKNKTDKIILGPEKQEYFDKKDIIKNDKIEIEYYNEGKLNKIYVPLNISSNSSIDCTVKSEQKVEKNEDTCEKNEEKDVTDNSDKVSSKEDVKRPFEPFTTEELRQSTLQVWENGNSSLVGKWNGDVLAQKDEVVRLMEELSSVQVFPESISDPNRPRACAFAEEDVKKMTKEIEEINFTQSRNNSDDFDVAYLPDGQGDADLESKSFTKSKDSVDKPIEEQKPQEEVYINSVSVSKSSTERKSDSFQEDQEQEINKELSRCTHDATLNMPTGFIVSVTPIGNNTSTENNNSPSLKQAEEYISEENCLHSEITEEEECLLKSNLYNESTIKLEASLDQVSHSNFSRDQPPEKIYEMKENLCCASYLASKEYIEKPNEVLQMDSINLKEFQNGRNLCEEFLPESVSLSGNLGSLSGSKQDEFTLKNLELSSELDLKSFQEKSDITKGSRSCNNASESTYSTRKGTVSLEKLNCATSETYNILNRESFSEEKNFKIHSTNIRLITEKVRKNDSENNNSDSFLRELNPQFDNIQYETLQNGENYNLTAEKISENFGEASVCNEKNLENLKEEVCNAESGFFEEQSKNEISLNDSNSMFIQNKLSAQESNKSLNNAEETYNTETNEEPSISSQTLSATGNSGESINENRFSENPETSETGAPKFKLHSQKMYFGAGYDPAGQALQEFTLLESEEAFIDLTESVIQVIEPPETSTDEDCDKISFSLLSEMPNQKAPKRDNKSESELPSEDNSSSENIISTKKVYSGMTTIGPLKNYDYDPRNLTGPEIDYGKMTRITSSRQLAKDMSLFSSDVNAGISVKIIEEDDSDDDDDDTSLNVEEDHLDRNSLLNRDIASLTKVQKVREVMSYQPKSEEDFEDEDGLPRPRLDLKDVESMTDERYKVPEVSIPLLSFEIDNNNIDAGKELIESMGLVISGLTSPAYYDEDIEEINTKIQKNHSNLDSDFNKITEFQSKSLVTIQGSKNVAEDTKEGETSVVRLEKESKNKVEFAEKLDEENELDESLRISNSNSQHDSASSHTKYSTLGSVFKKASSKILRKDVDLHMRNSKSLPRDTSKICTADSIRSILDDCQSSASSMLKKSKSLLKNTQSIFRSISQNRMSSDRNLGQNADSNKLSPSESDVSTMGKKFPSCLKAEYFTKTKISTKTMPEKTIRSFDTTSSTSCEAEITSEENNLQISDRNEENLVVDRTENFKKLLPKSPLIYKSQFVKSQMSFHSKTPESAETTSEFMAANDQQNIEEFANTSQPEHSTEKIANEAREPQVQVNLKEICFQEKLQWVNPKENLYSLKNNEPEPRQLDYIVMETIQGLPHADLESPSSEKENLIMENNGNIKSEKENDIKKIEASNSLQIFTDGNRDVAPCFPEVDEEKIATKTPSERKIKTKKKKFTARFRSFWCSAFGRVKTQSKKGDLS